MECTNGYGEWDYNSWSIYFVDLKENTKCNVEFTKTDRRFISYSSLESLLLIILISLLSSKKTKILNNVIIPIIIIPKIEAIIIVFFFLLNPSNSFFFLTCHSNGGWPVSGAYGVRPRFLIG